MKDKLSPWLEQSLEALGKTHQRRRLRVLASAPGSRVTVGGKVYLNLASNNYLGLAGDERLMAAAREALARWGAGATASRLLGGTLALHEELEAALTAYKRTEACAVFPSGYHANLGVLPALAGPDDTLILDRLSHASLVDGARLSKAKILVFAHNDPDDLGRVLRRAPAGGRRWVVTESVFSMDGDAAPLLELVAAAERDGGRLYVDEAHATGVLGPEGQGVVRALGLETRVGASMGTLSKALGSQGGYVAGSEDLVRWLHNKARSFIYSTALNPAAAGAALSAVDVAKTDEARRGRVLSLAGRLRDGLSRLGARPPSKPLGGAYAVFERGPIVPFIVGESGAAVALSKKLWEAGFFAPAVRPPTVPAGTARLRFSVTAGHTEDEVDRLLDVLGRS